VAVSTFKLYKKLSNELKFKYSELDYVEQACVEGNIEFEEYYRKFCDKHGISISELESKVPDKVKQFKNETPTLSEEEREKIIDASMDEQGSKAKKVFQRIFRGIAKKIHPDKFSNVEKTVDIMEKEEMFKKASYAFDNEKWGMLLEIAEELDVHPQKYEKINELLRDEISDVNKKIVAKQKSFGWHISEAETDKQRDQIVISFLKTLFNYTFNP
jgi:hypothetical protein